jgi:hypothetical protein
MTPQRKIVVAVVGSFIAGGFVIGTAADISFNRYIKDQFASSYNGYAVEAQFQVRTLARLRSGDIDRVIRDLDMVLDSKTIQLAEYESVVPPTQREQFVYRTLAEVGDYRARFPAHFEYPLQRTEFEKALALGKKAGGSPVL